MSAQATAVQLSDGRVGDGSLYEASQVYLGDDSQSIVQARSSAAGLIEIAVLAVAVPRRGSGQYRCRSATPSGEQMGGDEGKLGRDSDVSGRDVLDL